jgi:hypothetical protein
MRHTVIGIFDTYDQAEVARSALVASGFARSDIELQAAPVPPSPDDPVNGAIGQPPETGGVLANIERFFSMLFGSRDQPPEVAHYSEAVRRGGVLVAVDAPSAARADAARLTLAEQGAIDIDERAASWGTLHHARASDPAADTRDHSLLDELGLGSGSAVPGGAPVNPPADPLASARVDAGRARAYPHADLGDPSLEPLDPLSPAVSEPLTGGAPTAPSTQASAQGWRPIDSSPEPLDPLRPAVREPLTGGAPTSQSAASASAQSWRPIDPVDQLDESETSARRVDVGAPVDPVRPVSRNTMPDEFMEYEDDFRTDYESKYAATGARYEEYEDAYRYGATAGTDERYHRRNWDDSMETELRRDWESSKPLGEDTWERFKHAVRHGWDRVTGHHHT